MKNEHKKRDSPPMQRISLTVSDPTRRTRRQYVDQATARESAANYSLI